MAIALSVSDELELGEFRRTELPNGWRRMQRHPALLQRYGASAFQQVALFRVPSAVLPNGEDWNVILDPAHIPEGAVTGDHREAIHPDDRLLSQNRSDGGS